MDDDRRMVVMLIIGLLPLVLLFVPSPGTGMKVKDYADIFPGGKYFVSVLCADVEINRMRRSGKSVGIATGIETYITTSDNEKYENPKYLERNLKHLAKLHQELSRKTKDSKRWNKARLKIAKLHERITNQRTDMQHNAEEKVFFSYAENMLGDGQMSAAGYRQKLRQPLYHALNNRIKNCHM